MVEEFLKAPEFAATVKHLELYFQQGLIVFKLRMPVCRRPWSISINFQEYGHRRYHSGPWRSDR